MAKTRWASTTYREVTITMPERDTELAYLAGIIDGEGTIYRLSTRQRRWTVSIATTSEDLLEWLRAIGGRTHEMPQGNLGKKPCWRWEITAARDVRFLLQSIVPYMLIKRSAAKMAIEDITSWIHEAKDREEML